MTPAEISPGETDSISLEETLQRKRQGLEVRLRRLYELYSEAGNRVLLNSINSLAEEIARLDKSIAEESKRGAVSESARTAREQLHSVAGVWDYMSVREKRALICSLVERITVSHGDVVIEYRL